MNIPLDMKFSTPFPPSMELKCQLNGRGTRKGEVIMIVRMPLDATDSEIYIKTPRGHSGISMEPWTSSTWSKKWSTYHTLTKLQKTSSTNSTMKGPTGASAYTRLLVDRSNSETATGLPGLTESRIPPSIWTECRSYLS